MKNSIYSAFSFEVQNQRHFKRTFIDASMMLEMIKLQKKIHFFKRVYKKVLTSFRNNHKKLKKQLSDLRY